MMEVLLLDVHAFAAAVLDGTSRSAAGGTGAADGVGAEEAGAPSGAAAVAAAAAACFCCFCCSCLEEAFVSRGVRSTSASVPLLFECLVSVTGTATEATDGVS